VSDSPKEQAAGGPSRERLKALGFLLGTWVVFFARHLFTDGVPYYRDNLVTNLPLRRYLHERLLSGELPQWYPFESLGVPLIGQIANGVFHPATWLLLPFDPLNAVKLNLLLGYLVGLVGAYRLARLLPASRAAAACAAVAFGFGGYALGVSSIVFYVMSQATLPWVAWAALKVARKGRARDAAVLGVAWALVFLAGDPQGFALCALLAALVLVEGVSARRVVLLGVGGLVASLLIGVELWPSTVLAAQSLRVMGQASPTIGFHWALHPLRVPELLVPGYIPDPVRYRVVGELMGDGSAVFATTLFAGGVTLLLAAAGVASRKRLAWAFAALAVFALWMALGDRGGLLPLVKAVVPFFKRLRYPEKYAAFFWLSLVPLVAFGFDHLRARSARWAKGAWVLAGLLGALALWIATRGLAADVWALVARPLREGDPAGALVDEAWSRGLGWTAFFLALAGAALWAGARRGLALLLLPGLLFVELWHGNGAHLPLVPRTLFEAENPFVSALRATAVEGAPSGRVLREVEPPVPSTVTEGGERWVLVNLYLLKADVSGLYDLPSLGDNLGGVSARYVSVFGPGTRLAPKLGALFDGCFRVVDARRPLAEGEARLSTEAAIGLSLLRAPCRPRAYLAGAQPVAGLRDAVTALEHLSPGTVVWEGGPALAAAPGEVRWKEARPEHLLLEVDASAPTALVLSDELTEGWRATVDGAPAPLYPTLGLVRGLPVPAGHHQVEFSYRTPRFAVGALSSLVGLILAIALAFGARLRRFRPAAS